MMKPGSEITLSPGSAATLQADNAVKPLVTVIIVVRNGVRTLERALQSVFAQDRSLVECVVIDGSSTDGTVELLERLSPQIDRWVSEPDEGIYDAMNKGVAIARGQFVYFLGCDDVLLADVSSLRPAMVDPWTIYYGNVRWTHSPRPYDGRFTVWKIARRNICHQAIFYPAQVVRERTYSHQYRLLADWELNLYCFADKRIRWHHLPHIIALCDRSGASARQRDDAFELDRSTLMRRYLPRHVYWVHLLRQGVRRRLRRLSSFRGHAGMSAGASGQS